ncbi:histidine kinase dimerization/phospho-acceptor domain-containing protein [Erythrobacter oryzae]|uniref:histidine kinase dimerization/phospho-acceptor domain-containing protein n=1 Tax=Erythrobacter oryzae TaxID=3019556 RepID=UPI0025578F4A|nr:histidine kinase dimerization/phospho-acceptor domain-containing protein [Erythrobacter sp. COR-2]
MFFDDRLATVLRQRATGEASLRTQYRQLLDLLGRERAQLRGGDRSLLAAAWLRLDALAEEIPAATRARMIREPGWRFQSPDLVVHLADQEAEVAAAALTRADLASDDWTALIPRLPVRARGFLRLRRDLPVDVEALLARLGVHDRGLPAPAEDAAAVDAAPSAPEPTPLRPVAAEPREVPLSPAASPAPTPVFAPVAVAASASAAPPARSRDDTGRTEISALVERIAQFRRTRSETQAELERSPLLPLGELPERPERLLTVFGFATDTTGRIAWAAPEAAPMVIGMRLFTGSAAHDGSADPIARAFQRRQPLTRAAITLEGAPAITGDWVADAEPRFSEEGHFTGYFGRLRRVQDAGTAAVTGPEAREADRIRQLLHELRTPVTAVQGYAEVIQQQLFGPAPHEYRALAAAIAADAARILAGFEELDRLARLETGAAGIEPGETDLAALLHRTADQIAPVLAPQGAGLELDFGADACLIAAIDPEDAEGLVWRLLASLAAAAGPGERIALRLDPVIGAGRGEARLRCTIPARLAAAAGEANLFAATTRTGESAISPGLFGTGFALRLARAEARAAGGSLRHDDDALLLTLPLLGGNRELRDAANA